MLDRNKELLASVARTLGGEVRLESRHRRVPLDDQAAVLVVMGDPPRMVLTVLVEAFGVAAARNYVERQLISYFVACGVRVEGSSGDALQRARLDDPQASPDDSRRRLDEHKGCAIEDYERAIAARSRGLVRGRTAWSANGMALGQCQALLAPVAVVLAVLGGSSSTMKPSHWQRRHHHSMSSRTRRCPTVNLLSCLKTQLDVLYRAML